MFGRKNTNNAAGTTTNNNNNNNNNTAANNNGNRTSAWRWLALLLLILVFLCLVVIHVANYVYLRNASNNGLGDGYTGYSATTPIFETGIAEFVSLGFLILPLILLINIFSGWWDYRTAIVANVFAVIDVIVILFVAVGVIVVYHMDRNNAYGGTGYCNYHPQHTVNHTVVSAYNISNAIYNPNDNTIIGYNITTVYNTTYYNTTSDDSGSEYHFQHHYCKAQSTLLAGIVALLFFMLLTWLLSHIALNHARRHENTTTYQTTQTTYEMQPVAGVVYPAGAVAYPAGTAAYPTGTTVTYPAGTAAGVAPARTSGSLNNV